MAGLRRTLVLIAVVIGSNGESPPDFNFDEFVAGLQDVNGIFAQIPNMLQQATSQRCENAEVKLEIERRQQIAMEQIEIFRERLIQMQTAVQKVTGYINVGTCQWKNGTPCTEDQYRCNSGQCTLTNWVCDGYQDCFDGSDELGCRQIEQCPENHFQCKEKCIPATAVCDAQRDCIDGADEANCPTDDCGQGSFKCTSGECVGESLVCDGAQDCADGSDEKLCPTSGGCADNEFGCASGGCILQTLVCNGSPNCNDGSDEDGCLEIVCPQGQFVCGQSGGCLPVEFVCDGAPDCRDGSDENDCDDIQCLQGQFQCVSDKRCLFDWLRCNGDKDCDDGSDEEKCVAPSSTTEPSTPFTTTSPVSTTPQNKCYKKFRCESNGFCINRDYVCDDEKDCIDGSDEFNCDPITREPSTSTGLNSSSTQASCHYSKFQCSFDGKCIPRRWRCDGDRDCIYGTDEEGCPVLTTPSTPSSTFTPSPTTTDQNTCAENQLLCKSTQHCLPIDWRCDGTADCNDGSDEEDCLQFSSNVTRVGHENCPDNRLLCKSSQHCLPIIWRCDGIDDCYDASDEEDCLEVTGAPPSTVSPTVTGGGDTTCDSNQFRCEGDGTCIASSHKCDGIPDCFDKSDEENCQATNTCAGNSCSHGCEVEISLAQGYSCTCPEGMMLLRDRRTCVPIWNRGSGPGEGGLEQPLKGSIKG